jgi:hypothetical protein
VPEITATVLSGTSGKITRETNTVKIAGSA